MSGNVVEYARSGWEPKKVNANFFAYNHTYSGGFARASSKHLINISKDGGLAALFVVQGTVDE